MLSLCREALQRVGDTIAEKSTAADPPTASLDQVPYEIGISSPGREGCECGECKSIQHPEAKIFHYKIFLTNLEYQSSVAKLARNHSHNPYIHRLPRELASLIFTFCLTVEEDPLLNRTYPWDIDERIQVPTRLQSVCRLWRAIAFSTPQLWTTVRFILNHLHGPHAIREAAQHAQQWISRSGRLPLAVFIFTKGEGYFKDPSISRLYLPILDVASSQSHRWKKLVLRIPNFFLERIRGNPLAEVSILETLEINGSTMSDGKFALESTSSPAKVGIAGLSLRHIAISWASAAHVQLQSVSLYECLQLLREAPHLSDCDVQIKVGAASEPTSTPLHQLVHNALRCLRIKTQHPLDLLFSSITLPSLEDLHLIDDCPTVIYSSDSLVQLIKRSSSPITRLRLIERPDNEYRLIRLLQATPFVKELGLYYLPLTSLFFSFLSNTVAIPSTNERAFLPSLESLFVHGSLRYSWPCIADLFGPSPGQELQHAAYRRPLKSLMLRLEDDDRDPDEEDVIDEKTTRRLIELKRGGLELDIICEWPHCDFLQKAEKIYGFVLKDDSQADRVRAGVGGS